MGLSRMYCYVHYPTDVLAGAIVGTLAGLAAARLMDALWKQRAKPSIPRGPAGTDSPNNPDDRHGPGAPGTRP